MSCGVPCVATDVGDVAQIIGDTGRVVLPRDPWALAAHWQELIDMGSEQRKTLGERARRRIEEHYSLVAVTQAYESLYLRIINGRDA